MTTDEDFILQLATSSASLDRSPKKNWVENAGGLPPYVRKLARAIAKNGHSLDSAIAIAISRVKAWASGGGDVNADTRAKAVKAVAQWEAAKAKSHVKLSHPDGSEYIMLSSATSYNTEIVRTAWEVLDRQRRSMNPQTRSTGPLAEDDYRWVTELGSDYIVVRQPTDKGTDYIKFDYAVDADETVTFGNPRKAEQVWVEVDDELTLSEKAGLGLVTLMGDTPLSRIFDAAKKL